MRLLFRVFARAASPFDADPSHASSPVAPAAAAVSAMRAGFLIHARPVGGALLTVGSRRRTATTKCATSRVAPSGRRRRRRRGGPVRGRRRGGHGAAQAAAAPSRRADGRRVRPRRRADATDDERRRGEDHGHDLGEHARRPRVDRGTEVRFCICIASTYCITLRHTTLHHT